MSWKLTAATAVAALLVSMPADAAPITGTCKPTAVSYTFSSKVAKTTTSTNFSTISEGSSAFTHTGGAPSCVLVRVYAASVATGNANLIIRTLLTGTSTVAGLPAEVIMTANQDTDAARSYEFIFPDVAPGNYTLRLQIRSSVSGKTVGVNSHTIIVQHK